MSRKIIARDGTISATCKESTRHLDCDVQEDGDLLPAFHVKKECDWIKYPVLITGEQRSILKESIEEMKKLFSESPFFPAPCIVNKLEEKWEVTPKSDTRNVKKTCKGYEKMLNMNRVPLLGTATKNSCKTTSYSLSGDENKAIEMKRFFNENVLPRTRKNWLWSELK